MKKTTVKFVLIMLLGVLLFSACQGQPVAQQAPVEEVQQAVVTEKPVQPTATQAPTVTEEPTETADPVEKDLSEAQTLVSSYFEAVASGKSDEAAGYLSRFSLMVFEMTREDAVEALQTQKANGVKWSNLEIKDVSLFNDESILVTVSYNNETPVEDKEAVEGTMLSVPTEEVWVVRLENGEWLLNWNNLIDFKTMSASAETVNGVTVLPTQLLRFSDRIELDMLIQNRNNEAVVFGQTNETLGTFYFDGSTVVAENTRCILNALRTSTDCVLKIQGLYEAYPERVEIRKWNNYDVDPWYNFLLN